MPKPQSFVDTPDWRSLAPAKGCEWRGRVRRTFWDPPVRWYDWAPLVVAVLAKLVSFMITSEIVDHGRTELAEYRLFPEFLFIAGWSWYFFRSIEWKERESQSRTEWIELEDPAIVDPVASVEGVWRTDTVYPRYLIGDRVMVEIQSAPDDANRERGVALFDVFVHPSLSNDALEEIMEKWWHDCDPKRAKSHAFYDRPIVFTKRKRAEVLGACKPRSYPSRCELRGRVSCKKLPPRTAWRRTLFRLWLASFGFGLVLFFIEALNFTVSPSWLSGSLIVMFGAAALAVFWKRGPFSPVVFRWDWITRAAIPDAANSDRMPGGLWDDQQFRPSYLSYGRPLVELRYHREIEEVTIYADPTVSDEVLDALLESKWPSGQGLPNRRHQPTLEAT